MGSREKNADQHRKSAGSVSEFKLGDQFKPTNVKRSKIKKRRRSRIVFKLAAAAAAVAAAVAAAHLDVV
ncbi:hypothetical protein V1477_014060 [Vespula maculifrons]|uniref:Uncharacterized protein n=1 Tax=Vespula maculifrons TaxID=7453 RepID=A0ABD2BLJ0_VESMC